MRRRVAGAVPVILLTALAGAPDAGAQGYREYRAEREGVGTVRGPISDFWFKVRTEWAGYNQPDPAPPPEGGPIDRRTLQAPPPTRVWVSLVYGDRLARGGDSPLSNLFDEFVDEWKNDESRNWPYAQIHARPWRRMGTIGRRQNIIMMGTPWELPPVGPLATSLGITIEPGMIAVGERRYRGRNLVLVLIAPNPENPDKYALVVTGSGDEAVLQAGHLPYGETDYALFRGRRLIESGVFSKRAPRPIPGASEETARAIWGSPESWSAHGSHGGFSIRETPHYTLWYETGRLARADLEAIVAQKEAGWEALTSLFPASADLPRPVWYLYSSIDRKIDETAREEFMHVDPAAAEVHTVFSGTQRLVEPYPDIQILLHHAIGPSRVPTLERALAIALAPSFNGRSLPSIAHRALDTARRDGYSIYHTIRNQSVLTPADGPPGPLDLLLADFLRHMVETEGRGKVYDFVAEVSAGEMAAFFRRRFDRDLRDEVAAWTGAIDARAPGANGTTRAARRGENADPPAPEVTARIDEAMRSLRRREDAEAARSLEAVLAIAPDDPTALATLSRLDFRNGRFTDAVARARAVVEGCAGPREACEEAEAWARLTLGRVEAVRGHLAGAHVELTHPAVVEGPAPVPTLADYWLETMGSSRNQLTVVSHLKRNARVLLRRLEWDRAEEDLRKALEIDPTDGEAHRLLSEVYHKQHEYWAWMTRYLNQVHPDYNVTGRVFLPGQLNPIATRVELLHSLDSYNDLVLKGNLELLKAQSLYAVEIQNLHAEGDRHLIEQRDIHEALALYRRALELNDDFFLSHFLVGRCYFLLDRFEEARAAFEEVLLRRPTDALVVAWTHTYLGYMALEQDDLREARRAFREALSLVREGKAAAMAREGMDRIDTIMLLLPDGPPGR